MTVHPPRRERERESKSAIVIGETAVAVVPNCESEKNPQRQREEECSDDSEHDAAVAASVEEPLVLTRGPHLVARGQLPPPCGTVRETLNLVVGQYVIETARVAASDLINLFQTTPVHLLFVVIVAADDRRSCVADDRRSCVVEAAIKHSKRFAYKWIASRRAAICYRTDRISSVERVNYIKDGEVMVYHSFAVRLLGGEMNPEATFAVAIVLPFESAVAGAEDICNEAVELKEFIVKDNVRILGGLFPFATSQIEDIARSCGVSCPRPFCQLWMKAAVAARSRLVTHPSYFMIFGPCASVVSPQDIAFESEDFGSEDHGPPLPQWLSGGTGLSSMEINVKDLPRFPNWKEHLRSCGQDRRDLGLVKQKATSLKHIVPRVHQMILWVGTSRQGKQSKIKKEARKRNKRARR